MRRTAFVVALLLGSAAIAQQPSTQTDAGAVPDASAPPSTSAEPAAPAQEDTDPAVAPTEQSQSYQSTPSQAPADQNAADQGAAAQGSADQGAAAQGAADQGAAAQSSTTVASATPAGSSVMQPGNENPARDAHGVKVISAEATVPAGFNGIAGTAVGGPEVDPASGQPVTPDSYPPCSRTVTDNCLQSYERGRQG